MQVVEGSRTKLFWAAAFLGSGSIFILAEALRYPGGLAGLFSDGYSRLLIATLAALLMLPMIGFALLRTIRRPPAGLAIVGGALTHLAWKRPIPVDDVVGVEFKPGNFLLRRTGRLELQLKDGLVRLLPTFYLRGDGNEIARAIATALNLEPYKPAR